MDNPWENAWGDDSKPKDPWPVSSIPQVTVHNDLDEPAWSSKAVHWTEPTESVPAWNIPSADDDNDDDERVPEDTLDDDDHSSEEQPDSVTLETETSDYPTLPVTPPSPSPPPPPASPDAFGTFESALETPDMDPWTPSQPSFTVSDSTSWEAESSWKSPKDEPDSASTKADEWETAIRQKEKQDRFVPPELLASILEQFHELSKDIWPNIQASEESLNLQGVEDINELASSFQRFIPEDLTIPPTVEFSKTFTSKRLAESLKLTRHAPITRQSPFSRYASSKGSTAWEASVKARPELQDDLVPAGWRMVPKEQEVPVPTADARPKAGGGLLSFFGRRASTPPVSEKPPTSPVTKSATGSASSSPRPSTDTGRTSVSSVPTSVPAVPSPLSPTTSVASLSSVTAPVTISSQPVVTSPAPPAREATPPPSAVSRFLNRFSRTKSTTSPRNSLALSSDDLEFLSDIVPSASDDHEDLMDDDSHEIKALTGMIGSSPLPTKLPPPLAPPPKAPPPKLPQKTAAPVNDLSSFFDGRRPELKAPTFSSTSMNPSPAPSFGDVSPTQLLSAAAASRSITPIVKPVRSPAMPPMSPFALPSPTLKNFAAGVNGSADQSMKKVPTAIMSTTTSRPLSASQLHSAFTLPPPPTSRERTPVLETAPPLLHIDTPIPRPPPQSSSISLFDDDDFSEFSPATQSPPRQSTSKTTFSTSYADNSFTSVSSDQSLFSSTSSTRSDRVQEVDEDFDDFDDFVSPPTLRTPSPPAPPAKSTTRQAPPPKIDLSGGLPLGSPAHSPPIWQPPPPKIQKISRAAEHQRTLSLMETAASRQWPLGPPSPLPPVLQPPGGGGFKKSNKDPLDIFGISEDTMQEQQMKAMAALPVSTSSASLTMQFSGMKPSPPPSRGQAQTGGLSAQDLSFFEGL